MRTYEDFEVWIAPDGEGYRVHASGAGESQRFFVDAQALAERWRRLGQAFGGQSKATDDEIEEATALGSELFRAVFSGNILGAWKGSLSRATQKEQGVRVLLRIQEAGSLALLPWELLYEEGHTGRIALSDTTPVLRYPDVQEPARPLGVRPPFRLLGVLADPRGQPLLDLEGEWRAIERALSPLIERGLAEIELLPQATLSELRRRLRMGSAVHALHFAGHSEPGALDFLKGPRDRRSEPATSEQLATLIGNAPEVRLVVINACQGATGTGGESTTSVAFRLARKGVPAIVALQSPLSDGAAHVLAEELYGEIASGQPLEAAVTGVRNALDTEHKGLAWAAPVLYLRASNGFLFNPPKIRFTSHVARFRSDPRLCYFLNVSNLSGDSVEITHLWFEGAGQHISVRPNSRPLPHLLRPSEAWSSWISLEALPEKCRADSFDLFKIRTSAGESFSSQREDSMPPAGSVPGGQVLEGDKPSAQLRPLLSQPVPAPNPSRPNRFALWLAGALLGIGVLALCFWAFVWKRSPSDPLPEPRPPVPSDPRCPSPPGLNFAFQWIAPGEFWMGAPEGEGDRTKERPRHRVRITKPFCVGAYEVTENQWNASTTGANVETRPGEDLPKVMVSWESANEFLHHLNERDPGADYRLLTEAEFEYVAAAKGIAAFAFGDNAEDLKRYGNFEGRDDGYSDIAPIGSFAPNQLRLFDLHGNAQEWVADWFGLYPLDGLPQTDPTGPAGGIDRVRKGGSFQTSSETCAVWRRGNSKPGRRQKDLGFRIARTPIDP